MAAGGRRITAAARGLGSIEIGHGAVGIVLGSGLASFTEGVLRSAVIPYDDIPGFPAVAVRGHGGELVVGMLSGREVLVFSGRVHHYEGCSPRDVGFAVDLLTDLGLGTLVLTNASGGLDPGFGVGDLMLIRDQVGILAGRGGTAGSAFSMAGCYSRRLSRLAREAALDLGLTLREGIYVGLLGPTYETPAELELARMMGGSAIGMSTVTEVQKAALSGMDVLAVALISNVPLRGRSVPTSHEEVLRAGYEGGQRLLSLVCAVMERL